MIFVSVCLTNLGRYQNPSVHALLAEVVQDYFGVKLSFALFSICPSLNKTL